jgi:hypothetical protein
MRGTLFMICRQWVAVISYISHFFSLTVSEQYGTSWCGTLQSNVHFCITSMWNTDLLESVCENVDVNFAMRVPSRQTIHHLVSKLRSMRISIDKKHKHERRVLAEEKLDDIGARLEHAPRKSLKRLAQESGVSKPSTRRATQLPKLRTCKTTVIHARLAAARSS